MEAAGGANLRRDHHFLYECFVKHCKGLYCRFRVGVQATIDGGVQARRVQSRDPALVRDWRLGLVASASVERMPVRRLDGALGHLFLKSLVFLVAGGHCGHFVTQICIAPVLRFKGVFVVVLLLLFYFSPIACLKSLCPMTFELL